MAKKEVSPGKKALVEQLIPMEIGDESMTLSQSKVLFRHGLAGGTRCPCCSRFDKVYDRKFTSIMALTLRILYRKYLKDGERIQWVNFGMHLNEVKIKPETRAAYRGGMAFMPQHWGLIQRRGRSEMALTQTGLSFVRGAITIPAVAYVFHKQVRGYSEEQITLDQAFGVKFDLDELMES